MKGKNKKRQDSLLNKARGRKGRSIKKLKKKQTPSTKDKQDMVKMCHDFEKPVNPFEKDIRSSLL